MLTGHIAVYEGVDYELVWPRDLFVDEATVILGREVNRLRDWTSQADLLLEEAFAGSAPRHEFNAAGMRDVPHAFLTEFTDPFSNAETHPSQRRYLSTLVQRAGELRLASKPRPYWSRRHDPAPSRLLDADAVMDRFVELVTELVKHGYLEKLAPKECVDDRDVEPSDPSATLEARLSVRDLWPLVESRCRWSVDTFFDLVEVVHDFVARPRDRWVHDFADCGWHYQSLAIEPGRRLYRWRINRLLDQSDIPYRLANNGEDIGRLVAGTDEARSELTVRMNDRTDVSTGDRVRHAWRCLGAAMPPSMTSARR